MNWTRILLVTLCAASSTLRANYAATQETPNAAMEQGKRQYRNGDFRSAIGSLTQVVDADPSRADALYLIGYGHVMLRELADAADAFARAFAEDPNFDPRTIYQQRPEPPE